MGKHKEFEEDGEYTILDDEITDINSLQKYYKYMSTLRLQIHLSKWWANKQPSMGSKKRLYGLILKGYRIIIDRDDLRLRPKEEEEKEDTIDNVGIPSSSDDEEEENA